MLWIIHILLGMVFGITLNIPLIIILGLASHFILDMIPHWDGHYNKKSFEKSGRFIFNKKIIRIRTFDALLSFILIIYFFNLSNNYLLLLGAFFSGFPDILKVGYFTSFRNNRFFLNYVKWHSKIQGQASVFFGLLIQALFATVLISLLFYLI